MWEITDAEGGVTSYTYDGVGNLKSVNDPNSNNGGNSNDNGHTVTYSYDARDRLIKEIDALNQETTYNYDEVGNLTSVSDRRGNQTSYNYDEINRQIERIDADGNSFKTEYDKVDNVTKEIDELGRITTYSYDSRNRLLEVIYPAIDGVASTSSSTYDAVGNLLTSTDELGRTTEYKYDKINRNTEIKTPLGFITKLDYADDTENNLLVLTVTDAVGRETVSRTDGRGRLIEFVNADVSTTTYSYDGNDNLLTVVDELGRKTTYSYDELNRETRVTTPLGNTTTTEYDSNSNVVKITDHLNNATRYTYNELDLLATETDARGFVTTYTYDEEENLGTVEDPLDNLTEYTYDKLNRLETETQVGIGTRTYSYDEVSNLIQLLDRNGRIVQFAYDDWNRQTAELWLDGETIVNTIAYDYDAASQLVEVEDSVAKYSYEYDDDSRLTKEIRDTFGFTDKVVLDYTHDGVGNVLTVTDTVGGIQLSTETYTYDTQDRVTTISQTGNGVTPKTAVVTYDDAGQLEQLEVLNAFSTAQTFDLDGRPVTRTHTTAVGEVLAYGYEFDSLNRITTITSPNGESSFSYDSTDQLTSASSDFQEDESYNYDKTGNRLGNEIGPHNRLLNDGVYSYEYDAEGNRIQRVELATGVVTDYEWDWRNRLVAVSTHDDNGERISASSYQYDAFDRRLTKLVDSDGDGIYELIEGFVYNDDSILLVLNGDEVSQRYFYGPGTDWVLAEETAGLGVEYALTNHLNSVEYILDSAGKVINEIVYDSFGGITSETNPGVDVRYGFTGQDFDPETGLSFYWTRYYDFVTGTFLSVDRLGFEAGDVNLYRYVGNTPTIYVDPSGEIALLAGILAVSAIGAAIGFAANGIQQGLAIAEGSQEEFDFGEFALSGLGGAVAAPIVAAAFAAAPITAGVAAVGLGAFTTTTAVINSDFENRPLTSAFDIGLSAFGTLAPFAKGGTLSTALSPAGRNVLPGGSNFAARRSNVAGFFRGVGNDTINLFTGFAQRFGGNSTIPTLVDDGSIIDVKATRVVGGDADLVVYPTQKVNVLTAADDSLVPVSSALGTPNSTQIAGSLPPAKTTTSMLSLGSILNQRDNVGLGNIENFVSSILNKGGDIAIGEGPNSGDIAGGASAGSALTGGSRQASSSSSIITHIPQDYLNAVESSSFASIKKIDKTYTRFAAKFDIIEYINNFAEENPYGITLSEAHAIYGYTTKLFYSKLNAAMGEGTAESANALISLIESGLRKLPNANSIQYMGMGPRRSAPLVGKETEDIVTLKPFQSAGNEITQPFWRDAVMRAEIRNSQAKDISELSLFVNHIHLVNPTFTRTTQESLFLLNSRFEIVEFDETDEKLVILEQVF